MIEETTQAGPGAIVDLGVDPRPALEGATEYEFVEVFNPLSVDFVGVFGVTRPINAPLRIVTTPNAPAVSQTEDQVSANYGVTKNPDHSGKAQITNKVVIKSGKTVRISGDQAQVIVRQLVNEIMQREGHNLGMADPHQRAEVEARIIRSKGTIAELLGQAPQTVSQQLQQGLTEQNNETEFPDATAPAVSEGSGDSGNDTPEQPKRTVGRPPRAATT